MNEGDGLLAAILATPDDDTARLVYADWLQENGQPARAEFVRVQIAIAAVAAGRTDGRHLLPDLYQRERALWPSERLDWADSQLWRRGFIAEIESPAEEWIANADAALAWCPITKVLLTTLPASRPHEFNELRPWKKPLERGGDVLDSFRAEWPQVAEWGFNLPGMALR